MSDDTEDFIDAREDLLFWVCILRAEGWDLPKPILRPYLTSSNGRVVLDKLFESPGRSVESVCEEYDLLTETRPNVIWDTVEEIFKAQPQKYWQQVFNKPEAVGKVIGSVRSTGVSIPPGLVKSLAYYYLGRFVEMGENL